MNMLHIERLPDNKLMLVDSTGQSPKGAGFGSNLGSYTAEELRKLLIDRYSLTEGSADAAIAQANAKGSEIITLP
jgi:TnpA family transposase